MSDEAEDAAQIVREAQLKARRELRQRKILENAKNRLEKLGGRVSENPQNGDVPYTNPVRYPDPDVEQELFDNLTLPQTLHERPHQQQQPAFNMNSSENIFEFLDQLSQMQGSLDGNSRLTGQRLDFSNLTRGQQQQQQQPPPSTLTKLIKTKLHIAVISAITYVLFATGNEKFVSYSVFLPLLLWEIIEIFLLRTYETTSSSSFIIQILVLLTAIPPNHLIAITKMMNTLNKIFKDVGVFVFFFTLYHLVYYTFIRSNSLELVFQK